MGSERFEWELKDPKSLTEGFINYINKHYYESYKKDSIKYEGLNNKLFIVVTVIGFLVTILLELKEIIKTRMVLKNDLDFIITITAFILPSISSVILLYMTQKGYKNKEALREDARIKSKYLINEAKLRFSLAKNDHEYADIYKWLNNEIRDLQLNQARDYFSVHNRTDTSLYNVK